MNNKTIMYGIISLLLLSSVTAFSVGTAKSYAMEEYVYNFTTNDDYYKTMTVPMSLKDNDFSSGYSYKTFLKDASGYVINCGWDRHLYIEYTPTTKQQFIITRDSSKYNMFLIPQECKGDKIYVGVMMLNQEDGYCGAGYKPMPALDYYCLKNNKTPNNYGRNDTVFLGHSNAYAYYGQMLFNE